MKKRTVYILTCISALAIGGIYYLLFTEGTFLHTFLRCVGGREIGMAFPLLLDRSWLRFYFADFLWAVSLACVLCAVYLPERKGKIAVAAAVCLVGAVFELLQFLHVVPGTGDVIDVAVYISAAFAVTIIKTKGE